MSQMVNSDHIDKALAPYQAVIGRDFPGYRNHVMRMATFCLLLAPCSDEDQQKIEIAACFHDIGIWTEQTLDYLPPSVLPAKDYLEAQGLAEWSLEISEMILNHHKIRPVTDGASFLVELFRKGDLVDFSKGLFRFGLRRSKVKEVMQQFPNAGFHAMLARRAAIWLPRHPLNPLPMMKW